jgi:hypothetical protein
MDCAKRSQVETRLKRRPHSGRDLPGVATFRTFGKAKRPAGSRIDGILVVVRGWK